MRLFIAIDLPTDVRNRLSEWSARYASSAAGYKWVNTANLHITMKFIGERPDSDVPGISQALGKVPFPAPVEIAVAGIGSFPNVLFAKVTTPESLVSLARGLEASL